MRRKPEEHLGHSLGLTFFIGGNEATVVVKGEIGVLVDKFSDFVFLFLFFELVLLFLEGLGLDVLLLLFEIGAVELGGEVLLGRLVVVLGFY